MRPYLALFSARFRLLLQYRAAAMAGFGTQLFWGMLKVMIFTAFFNSAKGPFPMTLVETVSFIWLVQGFLVMLPWNTDKDVEKLIRSGDLAYELCRPLDLYWHWFWRCMAMRTAPALLRATPLLLLAGLFLGLQAPPSLASGGAFLVAMLAAVFLATAITVFMLVSMLWTLSGEGVRRLVPALAMVTSGMLLPLPLFPAWMQPLLNFLPFRGVVDIPFRLYLGHLPASQLPSLLFHQLAWCGVLIAAGYGLLQRGLQRVAIQGG